ncbi:protein ATAF2-like [Triticum dicoccoides]|uniref:protein ATAF2-like n=1 Tax=Triticum dicoccoides TaxID=85692 RepID=UPI000E7A83EC|nr:protein ATAF2-like [Triticum dicoccoides]
MCPPLGTPTGMNYSISDSWSDEELVRFLAERKAEDSLPENVLVGMDLTLIHPLDSSPGNIWYLNQSDDQQPYGNGESDIRKAKGGYWKCIDVLRIPTSKSTAGVKFSLEFYEGEAPSGKRTQWLMHEYLVEQNDEANVQQEYKSLCTIFMQGSKKLNTEDELLSLSTNAPSDHLESYLQYLADMEEQNVAVNSKIVSSSQQNSSSIEGKDIYEDYSTADGVDFVNALANEDYIEMKDLLSSDGSASTSEFSSRRSEEYFDSDALLRELLNDQNTTREIHQDCNHNIAGPTKSDCVVISPPEQGLVHNHDNGAMVAGTSLEKAASDSERDQHSNEQCLDPHPPVSSCSSNSHVEQSHSNGSSSSHGSSTSPRRNRSIGKLGKIGKKYCCLGSF